MFDLFKKNKSKIASVSLPDWGWKKEKENSSLILWIDPDRTIALSLSVFNTEPRIPSLKDLELVRKFYRETIADVDGGLIEVKLVELNGIAAIRTIVKTHQDPDGVAYLASLTIPFKKSSYVIKIEAPEIGTTGTRETTIFDKLLKENKIQAVDDGYENWESDPYDKDFKEGFLMNQSEEPEYDQDFPNHPLSRARILLKKLESGMKFNEEIYKTEIFNR